MNIKKGDWIRFKQERENILKGNFLGWKSNKMYKVVDVDTVNDIISVDFPFYRNHGTFAKDCIKCNPIILVRK